jgi:hypothetical protein
MSKEQNSAPIPIITESEMLERYNYANKLQDDMQTGKVSAVVMCLVVNCFIALQKTKDYISRSEIDEYLKQQGKITVNDEELDLIIFSLCRHGLLSTQGKKETAHLLYDKGCTWNFCGVGYFKNYVRII